MRCLDASQVEQLLMYYTPPTITVANEPVDGNPLTKLLAAIKRQEEILPKLSFSVEENRDVISQEIAGMVTLQEHMLLLIAFACTDNMTNLILALIRYGMLYG